MKSAKKNLIHGLLAAGFLTFTIIWSWLIVPHLLEIPTDFNFTSDIISTDNLFDEERKVYSGNVYSKTEYAYQTVSEEDGKVLIKNSFSVSTPEDELLFSVERMYGIDRYNSEHVPSLGDKEREGYLFAPRNLKAGEPFTYWHINYDGPAHMEYLATENLYGLEVYHYQTDYEGVRIDQTKNLTHLPEVGVARGVELEPHLELWVEPVTGRLVKYEDDTIAYFYDLDSGKRLNPWNHFSNHFEEKSVENNVELIRFDKIKTLTIKIYFPLVLLLAFAWFLTKFLGLHKWAKERITSKELGYVVGAILILFPLITLLDWSFNLQIIAENAGQKARMNPMTAIGFLSLGLGIVGKAKSLRSPVFFLSLFLIAISTLRLLNVLGFIGFEIDLILFSEKILSSSAPARMGIFTAIGLFLLTISLISSFFKKLRRIHVIEITTSICVLFSLLILTSYIFDLRNLLTVSIFYSVSFVTGFLTLIASTAIFALFREKDESTLRFTGWATISGILFVSIFTTVITSGIMANNFSNEAEADFEIETQHVVDTLMERLNIYINILGSGRGFVNGSENIERDEWKAYVESLDLLENYPGIQGLGYTIFVKPQEKEAHIQSIRAEGFPDYTIKPEGDRDIYTAIIYLEPFDERNRQAFGYDMFSNEIRRTAMEQARDTGDPKLSGKITLVQEIDEDVQAGFLIYVPVYKNGQKSESLEEKRANIMGYVYSPFRARDFVEGALSEDELKEIGLSIHDGTLNGEESELYSNLDELGYVNSSGSFNTSKTIYVAGRPWTITFKSKPGYGQSLLTQATPLIIIVIGMAISFLITFIVYTLITSRQKAIMYGEHLTENLRKEKAKDEAILRSIGEGLIVVDAQGKISLVNRAFENLVGWKASEVYGKTLPEVVPMLDNKLKRIPESHRLINKSLKTRIKKTATTTSNIYYQRKNGAHFPVYLTVSPIVIDGTFAGVVEVFRDITKEKEVDQAKTEFVSLASHQLRTPLTSIKLFGELLWAERQDNCTIKQKEYFHNIQTATQRMIQLVNDLLNVSRLESGKMAISPKKTDLKSFLSSVVKELKEIAKSKKIALNLNLPKANQIPVSIDAALLNEVLICFLSNAIRYTEPGKGEIEVCLTKEKNHYLIAVKDNGIGIPKKAQANIFKKFFRADNAVKKEADGSGLGLYIAHMIMEASGGKVGFKSSKKGSTFFLHIPLRGMKAKKGEKKIAKS